MAAQGKEEVMCAQKGAALSRQEGTVCAQLGEVTACDILGDWPVVHVAGSLGYRMSHELRLPDTKL